jgi:heptose-I-phosphate ethanolaminephosphotransferase
MNIKKYNPLLIINKELLLIILFSTPIFSHYLYAYLFDYISLKHTIRLISGSFFSIFIYAPIIYLTSRYISKAAIYIAYSYILLLASAELFYISLYQARIGVGTFFIIFESYFLESYEYLLENIYAIIYLIPYITLQIIILFFIVKNKQQSISIRKINVYILIFGIFMLLSLFNKYAYSAFQENLYVKMFSAYKMYQLEHQRFESITKKQKSELENVFRKKTYNNEEIYVLVIGESTNRHHMNLYGYDRNTTPNLNKIKSELFVFNDVISPHAQTIPSLKKVLTFANYENTKNFYDKGSLIQYMNKSGFETYWISNQLPIGRWETLVTVLAKSSNYVSFVNEIGLSFDKKILKPLDNALNNKASKKFIVIHLMGTHIKYCKRYPDKFKYFDNNLFSYNDRKHNTINCYDNAVLYNDFIISEIIRLVKKKNKNSFVLYFSDHGEDVYDTGNFVGHSEDLGTKYMFQIPFILWVSEQYRLINNQKVKRFQNYLTRKYMTDDVIYSLFDLMNITFESYDSKRSIFAKDFKFRNRLIRERNYDTEISKSE